MPLLDPQDRGQQIYRNSMVFMWFVRIAKQHSPPRAFSNRTLLCLHGPATLSAHPSLAPPKEHSFLIFSDTLHFCRSADGSVDCAILARVQSRLPQFITPFHVTASHIIAQHNRIHPAVSAVGTLRQLSLCRQTVKPQSSPD